MRNNKVTFDTRKLWRTKYSVSKDKIIKPLKGLEIEIEDGKTVDVRITNGLVLIEEILDNACWNSEEVEEHIKETTEAFENMWDEASPFKRLEYIKQIEEKLPCLERSMDWLAETYVKVSLNKLLKSIMYTTDVVAEYINLLDKYKEDAQ